MDRKLNRIRDERHILLFGTLIAKPEGAEENTGMKRWVLSIVCLIALALTAIPASAQTRTHLANRGVRYDRRFDQSSIRRYDNQVYRNDNYRYDPQYDNGYWDDRSTWERSRDKITTGIGAGAGAAVGAIVGGKRGAIIGAIAGGGGAALYTYVLRDKDRDRY